MASSNMFSCVRTQRYSKRMSMSQRRKTSACAAKFSKIEGDRRVLRGKAYVCKDNIDTDQIIPAEYLTLVPSKPDEYEKLGSYAMIGLPQELYPTRYITEGNMKTEYPIIIGGNNFGCGSSRCRVVVAESYARIFFRNSISTGELYPCESQGRLCEIFETGEEVEVDMEADKITRISTGDVYHLKPLGDAAPVIDAGGIFEYARRTGMIANMKNEAAAA